MKIKIFTSFLMIFLFLQCYSQADFRKGFVILNNNDTISGLIRNGSKKENSLKCVFIQNTESDKTIYYPDNIKTYRFTDGKYYVSRKIKSSDTEKIFLEFLFDGISDLYYYSDNLGDHYLIEKYGTDLKELKNEIKIVTAIKEQAGVSSAYSSATPVKYEKESKEYIGVLKNNGNVMILDQKSSGSRLALPCETK